MEELPPVIVSTVLDPPVAGAPPVEGAPPVAGAPPVEGAPPVAGAPPVEGAPPVPAGGRTKSNETTDGAYDVPEIDAQ